MKIASNLSINKDEILENYQFYFCPINLKYGNKLVIQFTFTNKKEVSTQLIQ